MIRAFIYRKGSSYTGYHVEGHAEYAEDGKDIYCAAVSMLVINTANCIEKFCGDSVDGTEETGLLDIRFPDGLSEKGTLLVETMIKGLKDLEKGDGKPYLEVIIEEE
ncbi:MAG: ribosomal-processing cysteine protease Prp [Lachnospiraceae bacterium]|jgi:uncharacterized protein YsxB (DUF464 family)|nr:ribosomal-processing cysteine protease Prp [Lachnospiraceae bacterium]